MTDASSPTPNIGVLTISDRAFRGEYEDRGGPAIQSYINDHFIYPYEIVAQTVPDELELIQDAMRSMADKCCLVLTTGGTGPAPRDVTPEATEAVCQKLLPGFGELMRAVSVQKVPTAILSRQTAGVCGTSLIVNLPGSPKAIAECLDPVLPAVPHAVRLAGAEQVLRLKPEYHIRGKMCSECNVKH
ncbi:Molybdopterin adenylyltransferase [Gracilaria domingensis]|nr:Molybdopterin adenylyltransferase [Gracilaria domingensis]